MHHPILQFFSFGTLVLFAVITLFILLEVFRVKHPVKPLLVKFQNQILFFVTLGAAACSLALSLYFQIPPCELCWYQRIFLFPLPIIAFVATVRQDMRARIYIFTLSLFGLAIALYHSFLQAGIFKNNPVFCDPMATVSCAEPSFLYYGFVTTPVISVSVFLLLTVLSYGYKK